MSNDFVLLLVEPDYHPESVLSSITAKFEVNSILHIAQKEELRKYRTPPLFDAKYLVIFESIKAFRDNKEFILFDRMLPIVHVQAKSQLEELQYLCAECEIPYKVHFNPLTEQQAFKMIASSASQSVSDAVCKAIVRQVGLNPVRIMTAISVCEQMGYTKGVVEKYIDRWMYPDVRKIIECLLGVPVSRSAVNNALRYLHLNRHWYRWVRKSMVEELDVVLKVYRAKLDGTLSAENVYDYVEAQKVSLARVMFASQLFEKVSISSVFSLREYLKTAKLMMVVLQLSC